MGDTDLATRFAACLDAQDDLCRSLEALADSLPGRLDTHRALLLSRGVAPTLRRLHLLEETRVFPPLMAARADLIPILDRLHAEHSEDEGHAGDLHDAMASFVAGGQASEAGQVGYMLRCMFVSLRRHVAFDRDHILPLVRATGG